MKKSELKQLISEMAIAEMAQISGNLKAAIDKAIETNPELDGLLLKKAIRSDQGVKDALDGSELYDNQLNKYISLAKGQRELGQRGRKPSDEVSKTKIISSVLAKIESGEEFTPEEDELVKKIYQAVLDKKKQKKQPNPVQETFDLNESKRFERLAGL